MTLTTLLKRLMPKSLLRRVSRRSMAEGVCLACAMLSPDLLGQCVWAGAYMLAAYSRARAEDDLERLVSGPPVQS